MGEAPFHALRKNPGRRSMSEEMHTREKQIEHIDMIAQVGRVNKIELHRRHVEKSEIESITTV